MCFGGWRKGPVSNFLLSPLPSEIDNLLVRISNSETRKSPQGLNLESRAAFGTIKQLLTDCDTILFLFTCQQTRQKFCGNMTHLQFVGQNQVVQTFTDSSSLGNFTDS